MRKANRFGPSSSDAERTFDVAQLCQRVAGLVVFGTPHQVVAALQDIRNRIREFGRQEPSALFKLLVLRTILEVRRRTIHTDAAAPELNLSDYAVAMKVSGSSYEAAEAMDRLIMDCTAAVTAREENLQTPDVVQRALALLDMKYKDPQLRLETIARTLGSSPSHLEHLLKRCTGRTLRQHIRERRLRTADELIMAGRLSMKEIAVAVGYRDPSYFSRVFRRIRGRSPTECRVTRITSAILLLQAQAAALAN